MTLKINDLKDMVDYIVEIDAYKSKMGNDEDIVTVSFSLRTPESATDLVNFIEKGYDFVLDADATPGEQADSTYKVFVEIGRDDDVVANIVEMLSGVINLTNVEEFKFRYYKNFKSFPATEKNLAKEIPITAEDYNLKSKETYLENYKNFFNRSYLESVDMLDDFITIRKAWADPLHFQFIDVGNREQILEGLNLPFNFNDFGEIIYLTKYIGDYNISKYGDTLLIENQDTAVLMKRLM